MKTILLKVAAGALATALVVAATQDPQKNAAQKADVGEQVNVQQPPASPTPAPPTNAKFTAEQLEQMVAPIALHPDSLVAQIFMAATYPLEVVEAERWLKRYPQLTGTDLEVALKEQDWDASVKSLCGVPTVLQQMSENLDWTQDLGDAFLGQQTELMDAVQRMRRKALDAGNLKTTQQQTVTTEDRIIVVESANPDVIYVPAYSPVVVFGGWYYPYWYYPAFYYPPPPGYGFLAFSVGFYWGWGLWGHCDWHHHQCHVDADRLNRFNQRTSNDPALHRVGANAGGTVPWTHDPAHRRGVNYRAPQVAHEFGAAPGASRISREQARGYSGTPPSRGAPERPGGSISSGRRATVPPVTRPQRPRPGRVPSATPPRGSPLPGNRRPPGDSSFVLPQTPSSELERALQPRLDSQFGGAPNGSRAPSFDRSASTPGAMSRGLLGLGRSTMGQLSRGMSRSSGLGRR